MGNTIIDPGDCNGEWTGVCNVLLTHGHFDHIYGLNELARINPGAVVYTNEYGRDMLLSPKLNMSKYHDTPFVFEMPDNIRIVEDGDTIDLGNGIMAHAIFTPGHNPSCITWRIGDMLFTGDAYIPGVKTVTNLPHCNRKDAAESERKILEIAASGLTVCPGHTV